MDTDNILNTLRDLDWRWPAAGVAGLVVLVILARALRRIGRSGAATAVTTFATLLGLGWSAQGMWDTAVHSYDQGVVVASVLFVVFECWLAGRMLRAHQYRTDFARRGKFITAVWTGAIAMALVVALGEGWSQAPGRLAIPLLVAYGWYTDLTADDDPQLKPKTTLRWTFRRAALAIGMLEPGERDAQTIDRDRLRTRMTRLAFRIEHSGPNVNDLLRRKVRLAKLKTLADDADLAEVRIRLARTKVDLMTPPPVPLQVPEALKTIPIERPAPRRARPIEPTSDRALPQGVHMRGGKVLRGEELFADGVKVVLDSVGPSLPRGYSNAELAGQYDPPLGQRTAEKIGAAARKQINGSAPEVRA